MAEIFHIFWQLLSLSDYLTPPSTPLKAYEQFIENSNVNLSTEDTHYMARIKTNSLFGSNTVFLIHFTIKRSI